MKELIILLSLSFIALANANNEVNTTVDLSKIRSVEGMDSFDRSKFINMHAYPAENEWDSPAMMDQFLNGWDVYMGRAVGSTLQYISEVNEDPNRKGFADAQHLKRLGEVRRKEYHSQTNLHQYEARNDLMISTHIHPFYPEGTPTEKGWTPASPEATAEFMRDYLTYCYGDQDGIHGEPKPKYFEVINEPVLELIRYKPGEEKTTREEIFEYHKTMAQTVKAEHPEILIGGFTQASPDHEFDNFDNFRNTWESFMDIAGPEMDFFSIHLYDKGWDRGFQFTKKGSNLEAILDLIEQASQLKLGTVKPFVISEYGAYDSILDFDPYTPDKDRYNLQSFSSMLLSFMDRPQHILETMPFIIMKAKWWDHESGLPYTYVLMRLDENGKWVYTHLAKFYELWSDVKGKRLDTTSSNPDIQTDAYLNGKKLYVIYNNLEMKPQKLNMNLRGCIPSSIEQVRLKHLHYPNNIPQLDDNLVEGGLNTFTLGGECTAIFEYTFKSPPTPSERLCEEKIYSSEYLKEIGKEKLSFLLNGLELSELGGKATLRLGLGRANNSSRKPIVSLNGHKVDMPSAIPGNQSKRESFFGVIPIAVPYEFLKKDNVLTLEFPDIGGKVSSVSLQAYHLEKISTK